ncbi:MAG: hypothetical protein NXY59_01015 [Aigarchaeota archaeon]|nr:hypothetical protein [Candidatus Pelearchaeum maunauluense]
MTNYATVSARIPKDLKKKADNLKLNINELIRRALEQELKKKAAEVATILRKIPEEENVKTIREARDVG